MNQKQGDVNIPHVRHVAQRPQRYKSLLGGEEAPERSVEHMQGVPILRWEPRGPDMCRQRSGGNRLALVVLDQVQ